MPECAHAGAQRTTDVCNNARYYVQYVFFPRTKLGACGTRRVTEPHTTTYTPARTHARTHSPRVVIILGVDDGAEEALQERRAALAVLDLCRLGEGVAPLPQLGQQLAVPAADGRGRQVGEVVQAAQREVAPLQEPVVDLLLAIVVTTGSLLF